MALILVVDDVATMAEQYAYDLRRSGGYETRVATGGEEALDVMAWEVVDCVILDLEMPGVDGFEVLRAMSEKSVDIPVIVYTGTGSYERCVNAIKLGAYGFIDKAEPMERVVREVENALRQRRLREEVQTLRRDVGADSPLVGTSEAMLRLKERIAKVAPIPSAVLIVGESGTGKELVAREIHRAGAGDEAPFVAINSAALPESLIESELFGHERGAFTGANRTRRGAFERSAGGTLFLDEVGELPLSAQAKLLRVLETRRVTRLGAEREIDVDARVVTATNRRLLAEVEAKRFREDLYYRLAVHELLVPPLRERLSDIPDLVNHLVAAVCSRFGVRARRVHPEALDALMGYDWKRNNVRELRNTVERMIIASEGDLLEPSHVPEEIRARHKTRPGKARTFQELKAEAERGILIAALERNDWQITQTARELGMSDHSSLLKAMRRHGIKRR
jgi:DNA-binding NtrC family response regulator